MTRYLGRVRLYHAVRELWRAEEPEQVVAGLQLRLRVVKDVRLSRQHPRYATTHIRTVRTALGFMSAQLSAVMVLGCEGVGADGAPREEDWMLGVGVEAGAGLGSGKTSAFIALVSGFSSFW